MIDFDHLVLWLSPRKIMGSYWPDLSKFLHNGEIYGGKFEDGGISLEDESYINCGNDECLNPSTKDWSIAIWTKIKETQSGEILAKGDGFRIHITPERKLWVILEGDDRLSSPIFVTCDDTYLYITDTYNHRIVIFKAYL